VYDLGIAARALHAGRNGTGAKEKNVLAPHQDFLTWPH
jgi:hypothetical protein